MDLIFSSGNGVARVDADWFRHAADVVLYGIPVKLSPIEELIWSKSFVMERERFDGADVTHLLRARGHVIDWPRLIARYGDYQLVLAAHLLLFRFAYSDADRLIPALGLRPGAGGAGAAGGRGADLLRDAVLPRAVPLRCRSTRIRRRPDRTRAHGPGRAANLDRRHRGRTLSVPPAWVRCPRCGRSRVLAGLNRCKADVHAASGRSRAARHALPRRSCARPWLSCGRCPAAIRRCSRASTAVSSRDRCRPPCTSIDAALSRRTSQRRAVEVVLQHGGMHIAAAAHRPGVAELLRDRLDGARDILLARRGRVDDVQFLEGRGGQHRPGPGTEVLRGELGAGDVTQVRVDVLGRDPLARAVGVEVLEQHLAGQVLAALDGAGEAAVLQGDLLPDAALGAEPEPQRGLP